MTGWIVAMDFSPSTITAIHELIDVENREDSRIEGLIARGARPRDRLIRLTFDA